MISIGRPRTLRALHAALAIGGFGFDPHPPLQTSPLRRLTEGGTVAASGADDPGRRHRDLPQLFWPPEPTPTRAAEAIREGIRRAACRRNFCADMSAATKA